MSVTGEKISLESLNKKKGISGKHDHMYTGVPTGDYDDGRDEKPWRRVMYQATRKGDHLYEPVKAVPSTVMILVLGVYLLLAYLTQLVEEDMPRVVKEAELARDNTDKFSEEEAWRYLHILMGDQPRVAGTQYHLNKTRDLKELVDTVASPSNIPIRTDWQMMPQGDYLRSGAIPYLNVYQNVSNVVAVLEGESGFHSNGTIGTSLLINCHYDSVPYAIGVSDDAIFCAVMVEVLSKLSRRSQRLKHNVVFLFNGAEENSLQGSHAFLSHEWSKGITNVVNLEAVGMNGKPIIFQVTDPRLLEAYRRVVSNPSGQSVGEFLFTTGVIPSDTDFRIWRDFGNFHGLDMAFIKWGHVYHTRFDHPDLVLPGVIQNAGNMLLALVREAADMTELQTQIEPSDALYYDYLYVFMVTATYGVAVVGDLLVAIFAALSVAYYVWLVGPRWSTVQELMFSMLGRLVAMVGGVLVTLVLVPIMVSTTRQLRYLSEPWIVVPLFFLPYIFSSVCASQAYDAWRTKKCGYNRSIRTLQAQAATRALLALLLAMITCVPALTTVRYVAAVPLFLMSFMSLASLTIIRYIRLQAWHQLIMEIVFSLPATMFMFSIALRFSAIMLPTMSRSHSDSPDYTIAVICVGLATVMLATVSGIELLFSRKRMWMVAAALAVGCIVIMFVPFSPYRDDGPSVQRHYWFHTEIVSYDYNNIETDRVSGILITKYDPYTISTVLPELSIRGFNYIAKTNFTDDCERFVHCNLPLFRLRFGVYLHESLFLYSNPPAPFSPESATRVQARACVGETCHFSFVMIGTAHNLISIKLREHVNLTQWTFSSPVQPSFHHGGRPVYVIIQSTATYSDVFAPLQFNVTLTVPLSLQSQPVLELSHHSHKIHHPEDYTPEYRNLINSVPAYFNIASFMSFRRNYLF